MKLKKCSSLILLAFWGKFLCLVFRAWKRGKAVSSKQKMKDVKKIYNDVFKSELTGWKEGGKRAVTKINCCIVSCRKVTSWTKQQMSVRSQKRLNRTAGKKKTVFRYSIYKQSFFMLSLQTCHLVYSLPSLFGCLHSITLLLMKAFALFIWSSLLGSVTGQHLVLHQLPWGTKAHTLIHWSETICHQIKCTHSGAYTIWA